MSWPYDCKDCTWINPNDKQGDRMWCMEKRMYVDPNSTSCSNDFMKKIEILEEFRQFKDSYMLNNPEAFAFAEGEAEEILSKELNKDENKENTVSNMINSFVKPAVACIKNKDYDTAIEFYKDMIISLMDKYNLDKTILNNKTIGLSIQRKRELQTV